MAAGGNFQETPANAWWWNGMLVTAPACPAHPAWLAELVKSC